MPIPDIDCESEEDDDGSDELLFAIIDESISLKEATISVVVELVAVELALLANCVVPVNPVVEGI
jgi:hypothetical protein